MKLKVKKGATVEVITGSEKGKKGTVLKVDPVKMKILVQGVRVVRVFDKKEQKAAEKEAFIDYSNVKLISGPVAKKATSKKGKASKAKSSAKTA